MGKFNSIYKNLMKQCNHEQQCGIVHEQYVIIKNNDKYIILENNRIIAQRDTLQNATELCNTINSGC